MALPDQLGDNEYGRGCDRGTGGQLGEGLEHGKKITFAVLDVEFIDTFEVFRLAETGQLARQTDRAQGDLVPVPTAASRYAENAALSLLDAADLPPILPTPASLQRGEGTVTVASDWTITAPAELRNEAAALSGALQSYLGTAPAVTEAEKA